MALLYVNNNIVNLTIDEIFSIIQNQGDVFKLKFLFLRKLYNHKASLLTYKCKSSGEKLHTAKYIENRTYHLTCPSKEESQILVKNKSS